MSGVMLAARSAQHACQMVSPTSLWTNHGSTCSWWNGLVFTNNLFREECLQAAVDNAVNSLQGGLLDAGISGVFLDGVIPYNLGCSAVDVNCTNANCTATPQLPTAELEAEWEGRYARWFAMVQAKLLPKKLLWVNNVVQTLEPSLINISNGRYVFPIFSRALNWQQLQ